MFVPSSKDTQKLFQKLEWYSKQKSSIMLFRLLNKDSGMSQVSGLISKTNPKNDQSK